MTPRPTPTPRRRLLAASIGALLATLGACAEPGRDARSGAETEDAVLSGVETGELPTRAEALLAGSRPWRASRAMRRYLDEVDDPAPRLRLLAARAEAGWGAWERVVPLLEGIGSLDALEDGVGLYLLARGLDEAGRDEEAVEAYEEFLALSPPGGALETEREAARLRAGLALLALGDTAAARPHLAAARERAGEADRWIDLLEALALAETGDTAAVRRAVSGHGSGLEGLRAWRARVAAALAAGDTAAARELANRARAWAATDGTRAEFLVAAARAALAMGDSARGRSALRGAIERDALGRHGREAAAILQRGSMGPADHLAVARVQAAQGFHDEAAGHFARWLDAGAGTADERRDVRLEYAESLFYAERYGEVAPALEPIAGTADARLLRARAAAYGGDPDAAAAVYLDMADEHEGTGQGRYALFLAADVRHEAGDTARARGLYQRVVDRYRGTDRAGLALMRLAGLAFLQENHARAAELWDRYRALYPRGERVLQATYWSGRAHAELGDSSTARDRWRDVLRRERDSHYALRASQRLGEPFWPLPMEEAPAASAEAAGRVARWMEGIDMLREAGFHDEASDQADRLVDRAGRDRETLYALAEALVERGYSMRAIRIGLRLDDSGAPDRRLLRILFPFPYRELVTEEARERGLDPFVAAALIRQESLWEARITSHAGARGLMQIMPATGGELATRGGMEEWDPEALYHPEVNVHLGTLYLEELSERYDGSLPSVFGAYNAGPHRVERWSRYPEYGREELFTERIPFRETRDYVKILTRNRALYEGLYGEEDPGGEDPGGRAGDATGGT